VADSEKSFWEKSLPFLDRVPMKDIVLMTKQAATLFEAQVSAVKTFELLGGNAESKGIKNCAVPSY